MSIAADRTEDWTVGNSGSGEPLAERVDRTRFLTGSKRQALFPSGGLLVGLRFSDGDDDAVGGELEVTLGYTCQLRPAKSARESDQHQSCVSKAEQVLAPGSDDPPDVSREKRGLSVLRGALKVSPTAKWRVVAGESV